MYEVILSNKAEKRLSRLPGEAYERVLQTVTALGEDPRPRGCRKLQGREGWRVRAGDYRAVYKIDDEAREVLVLDIGHRRDIYR